MDFKGSLAGDLLGLTEAPAFWSSTRLRFGAGSAGPSFASDRCMFRSKIEKMPKMAAGESRM
jgi:hypothetical protein